jgi:propionyl-CoA synthetase
MSETQGKEKRLSMKEYETFYRRSLENRERFWMEQAQGIKWHKDPERVLDFDNPPFARWFVGGETNLCHNAVDRHLAERGEQNALIYISTETGEQSSYTYRELHREVNAFAGALRSLGVGRGDRVIVYMPMVPEAIFVMLACVRLGAIHSVVFGGFSAPNLATRIDDAKPKVLVAADAGMRGGEVIPHKPIVDEALDEAGFPPEHAIILNRGLLDGLSLSEGRDLDYAELRENHLGKEVPVEWVESSEPSYILYTSGTTGTPKGVQRDTGGHAVALEASMRHIFQGEPGETMFTASDIGWVVGHSYIVYGPLLHGMSSILYDGLPIRPDPGIWWDIVEEHNVTTMFTAPTAIRALRRSDPKYIEGRNLGRTLRNLFLAGEPLDAPTSQWASESLGVTVRDNYWQTETGWPILSTLLPGLEDVPLKVGSAGFPCAGYDVRLVHEETGEEVEQGERGVLTIQPPLPPGCMSTIWGDDERFVETYFTSFPGKQLYSTFDWATRDEEGYYFMMGRSDDVINVAGHRLGTREIEESISSNEAVAEAAVIGVKDEDKGQVVHAYVVPKETPETDEESAELVQSIKETVAEGIGAIARPAEVHFVGALPKTRSGKMLRRAMQDLAEQRDPGELPTIENPAALEDIRAVSTKGA